MPEALLRTNVVKISGVGDRPSVVCLFVCLFGLFVLFVCFFKLPRLRITAAVQPFDFTVGDLWQPTEVLSQRRSRDPREGVVLFLPYQISLLVKPTTTLFPLSFLPCHPIKCKITSKGLTSL